MIQRVIYYLTTSLANDGRIMRSWRSSLLIKKITSQHDIRDCREKEKKMTSQHDIRDCNYEISVLTSAVEANTQYESFQRLTLSENLGSRAMSMSQENLLSSSPDFEIPMLHNPQSMNIMQSQPWTSLDEIKPANQKDSLLLPLLSY